MIEVNFKQGTPEWNEYRKSKHNASDAATMLGFSKANGTRDQLLSAYVTGEEKEFSSWVQENILDNGHAVEDMQRVILEKELGEELYPIVAYHSTNQKISASMDGADMNISFLFEHKQPNKELIAYIEEHNDVPDSHWPQLEQQLYVSGADFVLFVVSDGTINNRIKVEYRSKPERLKMLLDGWDQFEEDLVNFKPVVTEKALIAKPVATMPVLNIELTGMVTSANLTEYKEAALAVIANIKTELITDQDFTDAEAQIKFCTKAESTLKEKKKQALEQTSTIADLFVTIDELSESIRQVRLTLNKAVKEQKISRKANIVFSATKEVNDHVAAINNGIGFKNIDIKTVNPDFTAAIKGKSRFSSMQSAVNDLVAASKIEANNNEKELRFNINVYQNTVGEYGFLFVDLPMIIKNEPDILRSIMVARISEYEKAEAAKKEADDKKKAEDAMAPKVAAKSAVEPISQITKNTALPQAEDNKGLQQDLVLMSALSDDLDAIHLPEVNYMSAEVVVEEARLAISDTIESITQLIISMKESTKKAG